MDFDSIYGFWLLITVSIICQKNILINEYLEIWQAIQSNIKKSRDRDHASSVPVSAFLKNAIVIQVIINDLFPDFNCLHLPLSCVKRAYGSIKIERYDRQYKVTENISFVSATAHHFPFW